jgi:hypothetical protein
MSNYYRYIYKGSNLDRFRSVSSTEFSTSSYGAVLKQDYPLTSSINVSFYPNSSNAITSQYETDNRLRIKTLEPLLRKYRKYSDFFQYSSSYANYDSDDVCLVSIPSVFFGDSLSKGSIQLSMYHNGILLCKAEDALKNGELIQTTGSVTSLTNSKKVVGIILYDEGLIALFDDTQLANYQEYFYSKTYSTVNPDYPRWINWGLSANLLTSSVVETSYDIEFDGVHKIPQVTLLAHAPKGDLNYSSNYTFLKQVTSSLNLFTGSTHYSERDNQEIKNITKNIYVTPTSSFHKETYISSIYIYDEDKNVIGIAKLSKPVRKTEEREFTFKLKLDL